MEKRFCDICGKEGFHLASNRERENETSESFINACINVGIYDTCKDCYWVMRHMETGEVIREAIKAWVFPREATP